MDIGPARNLVTLKWYNSVRSIHCKIYSHNEDNNMLIALLTICE